MDLQNFSSLFEIYTAFNLTYIIIDELSENNFISIVADKILRKFTYVNGVYKDIVGRIHGARTSINQLTTELVNTRSIEVEQKLLLLNSIEQRVIQSFEEIKSSIRATNFTSKAFVYLTTYLFLYCLTVLFFGGLYTSGTPGGIGQNSLDNSLLSFDILSLIFLFCGWWFDQKRKQPKASKRSAFDKLYDSGMLNGYLIAFAYYLIAAIISTLIFYFRWLKISFQPDSWHNLLIVSTVLLPIMNFAMYIYKANRRANLDLDNLNDKADTFKMDFIQEIQRVEDFVGACRHDFEKPGGVTIVNE